MVVGKQAIIDQPDWSNKMSRTYKNQRIRRPKNIQNRKTLIGLLADHKAESLQLSRVNRIVGLVSRYKLSSLNDNGCVKAQRILR